MKRTTTLVVWVALAACACDDAEQGPSSTAASAAASAVPTPPPEPPKPWYLGRWKGSYEATPFRIEMTKEEGAVRAWAEDDAGANTGKGSIELEIAEDQSVRGSADGPLGKMQATGQLAGEVLSVRFLPAPPAPAAGDAGPEAGAPAPEQQMFNAFFTAKKQGDARFTGSLRASRGDSLLAREAKLVLEKVEGDATKAP